jgi:hypothetical protein
MIPRLHFSKLALSASIVCLALQAMPRCANAQDPTWFSDVSAQLGFGSVHAVAMIGLDVNNDDYPDLITLYSGNAWKLYVNQDDPNSTNVKDRVFVDATANSGLDQVALKDLACAADFNNDGNVDLVTNCWYHDLTPDCQQANPDLGYRCRILLGDGSGHFSLVTNSGLDALGPMSATGLPALDYDADGNLDLYIATHYTSWCGTAQPNFLVKGNGDGTFTDVSNSSGINASEQDPAKPWLAPPQHRALFGANVSDWNNDCKPDILTAPYESTGYDFTASNGQYPTAADTQNTAGYGNVYRNDGNGTFTDVGVTANYNVHFLWGDNGQGVVPWAAMPCDYDNDGDMDFLVLEVHGGNGASEARSAIFTNEGPANNYALTPDNTRITRKSPQSSHHGDHNGVWTDFDNDGLVDLLIGDAVYVVAADANRMFFCRQDASHQFTDITKELGFISGISPTTISDRIRRPSVMIPMDYDMDGDDDIFKAPYNSDDSLNFLVLRNNVAEQNHFIKFKLLAPAGVNKSCVGARVTVKAGGMKQMREVYADQGSWTNQYPFVLNFGLNGSALVDSVIVRWPDGACTQTVVTNVPADKFYWMNETGITSVSEQVSTDEFSLYPNPVVDALHLSFSVRLDPVVTVYNCLGEAMLNVKLNGSVNNCEISTTDLSNGVYWIEITDRSGSRINRAFVKLDRN